MSKMEVYCSISEETYMHRRILWKYYEYLLKSFYIVKNIRKKKCKKSKTFFTNEIKTKCKITFTEKESCLRRTSRKNSFRINNFRKSGPSRFQTWNDLLITMMILISPQLMTKLQTLSKTLELFNYHYN